jgi:hypothetical protein
MEQEPGSSYRNRAMWLGLAILVAFLFLFWLASPSRPVGPAIEVSYSPQSGQMGSFYSPHFVVAFVTNAGTSSIGLANPLLQWDQRGVVVTATADLWGGTNYFSSLGPNQVMPLPLEVPTNSTKFKVSFGYSREAGPLQRPFSPVCRRLFPGRIGPNQPLIQWLDERGWRDGRLHIYYEGMWEANR